MIESMPFPHNKCLHTADFEQVEQFLNARIEERKVRPLSSVRAGRSVIALQPLGGTLLFGARWSESVHIQSGNLSSCHLVLPLSGTIQVKSLKTELQPQDMLLLCPGRHADLVWQPGCTAIVATFDRQSLLNYFDVTSDAMLSDREIVIRADDSTARSALNLLRCIAIQHDIQQGTLSVDQQRLWEQMLIECLSDLIQRSGQGDLSILPVHIKRTTDWIMANIEDAMTIRDLLPVAGCSRRALENGFRQYHGISPARFIVRKKLECIHAILQRRQDESVCDLAFRFGFSHPSHFTRHYKRQFGETPSETLGRRTLIDSGR